MMNPTLIPAVADLRKKLLERYPERLRHVILYGSVARGDHTTDSDIDILVVLEGTVGWDTERIISDLSYDVGLVHDVILDVHVLSIETFESAYYRDDFWLSSILREGIEL